MLLDRFYGMLRSVRGGILDKRTELSSEEFVEKYPTAEDAANIFMIAYSEATGESFTILHVKDEADRMIVLIEKIDGEPVPV